MTGNENFREAIGRAVSDRPLLRLGVGLLTVGIICSLIVGLSIHSSDVTVYSRYTAFGEAHFYKSHWQYLLLFVLFNIVVIVAHAALMVKLQSIERRQTALLLGWIGIVILMIATVYAISVIQLGQAA
jgi:hypothetical protein